MSRIDEKQKNHRLNDSKVFCMAPWVSLNNQPTGDIKPCCVYDDGSAKFGNLYKQDIRSIWNDTNYKNFRKDLMNDVPNKGCERCYKYEEWGHHSFRKTWNDQYGFKYDELIGSTDTDGTVNKMQLLHWDFRFSNLCNLTCIGCSPEYSSSWAELRKRISPESEKYIIHTSSKNKIKFFEQIKSQISNVGHIYFAGGEPLIQQEHYDILKEIYDAKRLNEISFSYSTNLTNLHFKKHYVIDYWKKMTSMRVMISLDEIDKDRLYYIRHPSDVDNIVENLKIVNSVLNKNKKHWIATPAWSIFNLHRIKNFMEFFHNNDLLPYAWYTSNDWETEFHHIIMMKPEIYCISNASKSWKKHLKKQLTLYQEWYGDVLVPLKSKGIRDETIADIKTHVERFKNVIDEERNFDQEFFNRYIAKLDQTRETDFKKTFPELKWMLKDN